jgi:hypothetical protein
MATEDQDKTPLPYRNYDDDRPLRRTHIASILGGGITGALITAFFGCANFLVAEGPHRASATSDRFDLVLLFGIAAIVTSGLGILALRSEPRRFMLGGILLGIGVTALIEGICFYQ